MLTHEEIGVLFNEQLSNREVIASMGSRIQCLVSNGFKVRVLFRHGGDYWVLNPHENFNPVEFVTFTEALIRSNGVIRGLVELLEEVPDG